MNSITCGSKYFNCALNFFLMFLNSIIEREAISK